MQISSVINRLTYFSPGLAAVRFLLLHLTALKKYRKDGWYIYVDRPIFGYEIKRVSSSCGPNVLPVSARFCKEVLRNILGEKLVGTISDYNYQEKLPLSHPGRIKLYCYWARFLTILRAFANLKGVISCNYIFALHIEMNRACVQQGLPFITLFKESINAEESVHNEMLRRYKQSSFLGTKILTYNSVARDMLIQCPGVDSKDVVVVGFPRADELLTAIKNRNGRSEAKILTLFWCDLDQKALLYPLEYRSEIKQRVSQFFVDIFRYCIAHSKYRLRIKLKVNGHSNQVDEFVQVNGLKTSEPVEVITQGDPFELLAESDVVCGFNSTTLIEGLATGAKVLEPLIPKLPKGYLFLQRFQDVSQVVETYADLERVLESTDFSVTRSDRAREALEHYFGFLDGKNRERVAREILSAQGR